MEGELGRRHREKKSWRPETRYQSQVVPAFNFSGICIFTYTQNNITMLSSKKEKRKK